MSEPDELYTLRALYWLGHYDACVEEAKSISRKPLPSHLKVEKEQFVLRALLALKQYDKVIHDAVGDDKGAGTMKERETLIVYIYKSVFFFRNHPTLTLYPTLFFSFSYW